MCLITDRQIHINVKLTSTVSEVSSVDDVSTKRGRTWIKEIGVMWRADGAEHSLLLVARDGKEQGRGKGFLERVEVDGRSLPLLQKGETFESLGGLNLRYVAKEKAGSFDVDYYSLKIGSVLDVDLRLRVAHPRLQTETSAQTHFNSASIQFR